MSAEAEPEPDGQPDGQRRGRLSDLTDVLRRGVDPDAEWSLDLLDTIGLRVMLAFLAGKDFPEGCEADDCDILLIRIRRAVPDEDLAVVTENKFRAARARAQATRFKDPATLSSTDLRYWLAIHSIEEEDFHLAEYWGKEGRALHRHRFSAEARRHFDAACTSVRGEHLFSALEREACEHLTPTQQQVFQRTLGCEVSLHAQSVGNFRAAAARDGSGEFEAKEEEFATALLAESRRRCQGGKTSFAVSEPEAHIVFKGTPALVAITAAHPNAEFAPQHRVPKNEIFKPVHRAMDAAIVAPCTDQIQPLPAVCVEVKASAAPPDYGYEVDITRVLATGAGALRRIQDCTHKNRLPEFYGTATVFGIFFSANRVTVFRMVPVCLGPAESTRDMKVQCDEFASTVRSSSSDAVLLLVDVVPQLLAEVRRTVAFMATLTEVHNVRTLRQAPLASTTEKSKDEGLGESPAKKPRTADGGGSGSGSNDVNDNNGTTGGANAGANAGASGGTLNRVYAVLGESGVDAISASSPHKNAFDLDRINVVALTVDGRTQVVYRDVPPDVLVLKSGLRARREFNARQLLRYSCNVVRAKFMHLMADEDILIMVFPSLLSAGDLLGGGYACKYSDDSGCLLLAIDVLRGVRDLHAHGLAHRDIKPDNLRGGRGGVAITDFDLAKPIDELHPGDGAGTIGFIAPELRADDQSVTVEANFGAEKLAQYRSVILAELDVRCGCEGGHAPSGAIDLWSLGVSLAFLFGVTPRTPRAWTELSRASTATEIVECLVNPCPVSRGTAEDVLAQLEQLRALPAPQVSWPESPKQACPQPATRMVPVMS